jgi:hypothetical protein
MRPEIAFVFVLALIVIALGANLYLLATSKKSNKKYRGKGDTAGIK